MILVDTTASTEREYNFLEARDDVLLQEIAATWIDVSVSIPTATTTSAPAYSPTALSLSAMKPSASSELLHSQSFEVTTAPSLLFRANCTSSFPFRRDADRTTASRSCSLPTISIFKLRMGAKHAILDECGHLHGSRQLWCNRQCLRWKLYRQRHRSHQFL